MVSPQYSASEHHHTTLLDFPQQKVSLCKVRFMMYPVKEADQRIVGLCICEDLPMLQGVTGAQQSYLPGLKSALSPLDVCQKDPGPALHSQATAIVSFLLSFAFSLPILFARPIYWGFWGQPNVKVK